MVSTGGLSQAFPSKWNEKVFVAFLVLFHEEYILE
jgi:hypothetical protein